jgi:CubicO group peptidase (beta-lactamase class C family)
LVEQVRADHDAIALAAAVVDEKGVLAIGVAGLRQKGSTEQVQIEDKFHIGSCTKSMTAMLCGMLVEQEKLSWDSTIGGTFPELKDKISAVYLPVTLQQLLCHRGGLPEDGRPGATFSKMLALEGEIREKRIKAVELLLNEKPGADPGSKFIYANAGFVIAGAMAERATGKSWEALTQTMLFEPLGMGSAGFGAPGTPDKVDQPRGHAALFGSPSVIPPGPRADNPEVIGPAGRVHCSLLDWAKYAAAHLAEGRGDRALLEPATFEKLHSDPFAQDYGFGWGQGPGDWAEGPTLQHAGSNGRWYARIHLDRGRKVGYLIAANHADPAAVEAVGEMLPELVKWGREHPTTKGD